MRKLNLFCIVILFASFAFAGKVATFPELINPGSIILDKDQIFIVDGVSIYIYSLKDFSLQKKFGRAGEGPQEFKTISALNRGRVNIHVESDYILVSSIGKVSFFKRNGDFKSEIKTTSIAGWYLPVGKRFVGGVLTQENLKNYVSVNFYNSDFVKEKSIYKVKIAELLKGMNPITTTRLPLLYVSDNKIFIDGEEGIIHVFDVHGKELPPIKPHFKKVKVTEDDKNRYLNWYKTDIVTRQYFEALKKLFVFPEYFPNIRWYNVADKKVYILSYKKKEDKSEFYIYDLKGKFLAKVLLPLEELDDALFSPYTIKNGKLYQLVENKNNEEWELHGLEIK